MPKSTCLTINQIITSTTCRSNNLRVLDKFLVSFLVTAKHICNNKNHVCLRVSTCTSNTTIGIKTT